MTALRSRCNWKASVCTGTGEFARCGIFRSAAACNVSFSQGNPALFQQRDELGVGAVDALVVRGIHVVGEQHQVAQDGRIDVIVAGLELGGQRPDQCSVLRAAIILGVVPQPGRADLPDRERQRAHRMVVRIVQQVAGETDFHGVEITKQIGDVQRIVRLDRRRHTQVQVRNLLELLQMLRKFRPAPGIADVVEMVGVAVDADCEINAVEL